MASALALFELNTRPHQFAIFPLLSCGGPMRKNHSEIPRRPAAAEAWIC